MINYPNTWAALGVGVVAVGALWLAADHTPPAKPHVAHSDDEPGYDCRTQGPRTCGSDVAWQGPGTYPAPDGGAYTVVLVTPYMACLRAANIPGPSGFAGEVCEPLAPGFKEPPTVTRRPNGCVLLNRTDRYCPDVKR